VELGSINSLRLTGSDISAVGLDFSAWMQFVEPSARKTERVIVSFMIGEKIGAERLNSFLDLGPPFSYIALGTAVGFAGSSSSETSDTLICRKKPREFNAHRDGKRFIVKADDLLTAFLSLDSAFSAEMTLEILYIKNW
jgi:hypothetical protein